MAKLRGSINDDVITGYGSDDRIRGGYGDDTLNGGDGADRLNGGRGSDVLTGGTGDDVIVSRSDAGEPTIAQAINAGNDPNGEVDSASRMIYPGQAGLSADDVLTGGAGADKFRIETLISAKADILAKHADPNTGEIDYAAVVGENNLVHDHWVDSLGNDTITDFNQAEGDTLSIKGHTTEVYKIDIADADGDGAADDSVLHLRSNQGAGGGAHNLDLLGTVTVLNNQLTDDDFTTDAGVTYGIVRNISQVNEAIAPLNNGAATGAGDGTAGAGTGAETGVDADAGTGGGTGTGTGTATGTETGTRTGAAAGSGTGTDTGAGTGSETGTGMVGCGSHGGSSGAGGQSETETVTDPGSGAETGGAGTGTASGETGGTSAGSETEAGAGAGTGTGTETGDTGTGAGTDAGTGTGSETGTGTDSGTGTDTGAADIVDPLAEALAAPDDAVISGTATRGDDVLVYGATADVVSGGNGDDLVVGGEGDDILAGGWGDDRIDAGAGGDHVHGGHGADLIAGYAGDDLLTGDTGDDILHGGDGADRLRGGRGEDVQFGGAGADNLNGGAGDDLLMGGAGSDVVNGGSGIDAMLLDGDFADYTVEAVGNEWRFTNAAGETDAATRVEQFHFIGSGDTYVLENGALVLTDDTSDLDDLMHDHLIEDLIAAEVDGTAGIPDAGTAPAEDAVAPPADTSAGEMTMDHSMMAMA
jgi:Ca2+-binding RTX toxin-like protein